MTGVENPAGWSDGLGPGKSRQVHMTRSKREGWWCSYLGLLRGRGPGGEECAAAALLISNGIVTGGS